MRNLTNIIQRRLTATVLASFLVAGVQAAVADEVFVKPSVREAGELKVGTTLSYAPFEFIGEDNKPTGIDIELANQATDLMGVELKLVTIPFVNSLPSLAAGRTDISWASYTIKEERLKQVDFVTFMEVGSVVSTLPENAGSIQTQMDLCGKSLAVSAGSAASFTAETLTKACTDAGNDAITISVFPDSPSMIQAVLSGRVDINLDDSTASGYYATVSGGKLVVLPEIYDPLPIGLAVPKGDKEAAEMMRSALQALIDNGSYAEIFARYGISASSIPKAYVVRNISELR